MPVRSLSVRLFGRASGAQAMDFDRLAMNAKSRHSGFFRHRLHHVHRPPFLDLQAVFADQKQPFVPALRKTATDERIQAFHPVDESLLQKEVQSPIDRGRLRRVFERLDSLKQIIGFGRAMAFPDQFEHLAPNLRKPNAAINA